jgi:Ca2+-binding EF-hand superfamily protein
MASALRSDQVNELRALFDLFDGDGDGLLEVEEVGAIWAACGTVLTEAECLDMVTSSFPCVSCCNIWSREYPLPPS